MKKISLLLLSIAIYSNIFANFTQSGWRWRNDDGSQLAGTWKAPENTGVAVTSTNEIIRLRIQVYNSSFLSGGVSDSLQYATSISGTWTTLSLLPGSNAFVSAGTSAFVTQDEPTTMQLNGIPPNSFSPGITMVSDSKTSNYVLNSAGITEFEWAIRGTENTVPNTTYYFRQAGTTLSYLTYPSITTAGVLPIKITGFTISRQEQKIKLEWGTASEQNNDRFEVQRSSDGRTWKTIAKVNGQGSSISNNYQLYDESPLTGINYYRIKQYDIDGHSYQSAVKSLKMIGGNSSKILITPNPARAGINFSLTNQNASDVEAILTNVNGSIIHHEIIKNVQANLPNKLNLRYQPAPGVYFLKLKGDALSKSARIVIE